MAAIPKTNSQVQIYSNFCRHQNHSVFKMLKNICSFFRFEENLSIGNVSYKLEILGKNMRCQIQKSRKSTLKIIFIFIWGRSWAQVKISEVMGGGGLKKMGGPISLSTPLRDRVIRPKPDDQIYNKQWYHCREWQNSKCKWILCGYVCCGSGISLRFFWPLD